MRFSFSAQIHAEHSASILFLLFLWWRSFLCVFFAFIFRWCSDCSMFDVRFAYSNFELMPDNKRARISFATKGQNENDAREGTHIGPMLCPLPVNCLLSFYILQWHISFLFRKAMSKYCDAADFLVFYFVGKNSSAKREAKPTAG